MATCGDAPWASPSPKMARCLSPMTARNPSGASATRGSDLRASKRGKSSVGAGLAPPCGLNYLRCLATVRGQYRPSISQFLIHDIEQGFALPKSFILIDEKLHRIVQPVRCVVRAMRRKQYVFKSVERMPRWQRLVIEHVQRRSTNSAAGERRNHRLLVDHRTAPDIDHYSRRLHSRKLRLANHPARLGSQRRRHNHIVAPRNHFEAAIWCKGFSDQRVGAFRW